MTDYYEEPPVKSLIKMIYEDEIERLNGEIELLRAALQWQPIETAPKDATEILIYHTGMVSIGWFTGAEWCYQDSYLSLLGEPTHWMPLPKPPEGEK